jgi:hypothetical protein
MTYTFVRGSNIPEDVKVGDSHTWLQMRPMVGGYPGRSGGPPKEITGRVIGFRDLISRTGSIFPEFYVDVEAEKVEAFNG